MIPESWLTIAAQSALLLLTAALIAFALQRGSAALRHHVWTLTFGLLLLLPFWPETAVRVAVPVSSSVTRIVVNGNSPSNNPIDLAQGLKYLWLAGCCFLLARTAAAQVRAHRIAAKAGYWQGNCYLSNEIEVPIATGLIEPRILLPRNAPNWPADRLSAVLAHEHMHLVRKDLWWQLLCRIATAVYWPNPLVWYAAYRHYKECEQACDDGVLESGVAASDYAQHLVEIARGLTSRSQIEGGLAMATTTTLEHRLRAMLNPLTSHKPMRKGTVLLSAALSLMLLAPVAGLRLVAQTGSAGIRGIVVDASGANVPGAKVTLRFLKPGSQRIELVRTTEAGEFSFPNVPEDSYSIIIEKEGFAALSNNMLKLGGENSAPLRFSLNVGDMKESIGVSAGLMPPPPPPPPPSPGMSSGTKRIRIGGNVQSAKILSKVNPVYPADCRNEGVQGIVLLNAVVGKAGEVLSLEPVNQFVDTRLRESALSAVRLWRYQPTLLNGEPVEVTTQIEINFTLSK